jgi:Papain fold toxin 2
VVLCLTEPVDDTAIAELYEAIGNIVTRFPLLHCQECASTLKKWLKQRGVAGKLWRISTRYDHEDLILSDRLEQQGCFEIITENGVH